MPLTNISDSLVDRYSGGPTQAKVDQASSLRRDVETALGADYLTFLQGSYRNSTGVAELNDVDIVALARTIFSPRDDGPSAVLVTWDEIFQRVESRLQAVPRFRGRISRGDKCVKVDTDLSLDVVPAIYRGDPATDPVEVFSFRENSGRDNHPRTHWDHGVTKNNTAHTDGAFKPTVRLFKRWARNVLDDPKVAPSFYIECAVHHAPDERFNTYLPASFVNVGLFLIQDVSRSNIVRSVAGDKDILVSSEWHPDRFEQFQRALTDSVIAAGQALSATTSTEANRLWKKAFGE